MIGLYGRGDRRTTAWRATLYLGLASMVLLAALLMIGTQAGFTFSGLKDFAWPAGAELPTRNSSGPLLIAGFGTLISLFPFHFLGSPRIRIPPAPVAMMHAGVLRIWPVRALHVPAADGNRFLPWTNILLVLLVCNVIWVGVRDRPTRKGWTCCWATLP